MLHARPNQLSPMRTLSAPAQAYALRKGGYPIHVGDHAGMSTGAFGLSILPKQAEKTR